MRDTTIQADPSWLEPRLRDRLANALGDGEQVGWIGRPSPGRALRRYAGLWLFGLLWWGFLAVFAWLWLNLGESGDWPSLAELAPLLFLLPFVAVGLVIAMVPLLAVRAATRTAYALTDRRLIVLKRKAQSYWPMDLQSTELKIHPNGLGEISLQPRAAVQAGQSTGPDKLLDVPEPDRVHRMLNNLVRGAGLSGPDERYVELFDGLEISRLPVGDSSASFRTGRLVALDAGRVRFQPTLGARLFFLVFLGFGLMALLTMLPMAILSARFLGILLIAVVGGVFVAVGLAGLTGRFGTHGVTFDRRQGRLFSKNRKLGRFVPFEGLPLSEIVCLQICSREVTGDDSAYTTYELNLILRDDQADIGHRRVSLTCHAKRQAVYGDAGTLAAFLDVPLLEHATSG